MRIATWNMDYWQRSNSLRSEAWSYLRDRVRPDIALLQEALPSGDGEAVVFRPGGIRDERTSPPKDLGWGSAIVSFGPPIRPIEVSRSPFHDHPTPLLRTFPGCVAIAEVGTEDPIVVVSAYGLIDRGYAEATVHRILSDLTPLIDERRTRRIVVAGDLNITTQWSVKHRKFLRGLHEECLRRDRNLFDRFTVLGLHNVVVRSESSPLDGCDCREADSCRHVRTQRHNKSPFPWQNDYIFVTSDLLACHPTVQVFDEERAWALSNHCPVVMEVPDEGR